LHDEIIVNDTLMKFANKYQIKVIATNDSHYVDEADANAHDILLCINTNEKLNTPKIIDYGDEETSTKGRRFAFPNDQFYFKTQAQMNVLFSDIPESLDNTLEIVSKIETLDLKKEILLPNFPIPDSFKTHTTSLKIDEKTTLEPDVLNQWEYLKDLTFKGAKRRYTDITPEVEERLTFELDIIRKMGFAGYFLIVSDFIKAGKDLGVIVGPGRGSAAGGAGRRRATAARAQRGFSRRRPGGRGIRPGPVRPGAAARECAAPESHRGPHGRPATRPHRPAGGPPGLARGRRARRRGRRAARPRRPVASA
jgi:DNA polymerase-3 subunit alpha